MTTPQHFLVLGATGKIGSALVHRLLGQRHRVTAVAHPSTRLDALAQAGAVVAAGDLHDTAFLTKALTGADAAFLMIPPNVTTSNVLNDMHEIGKSITEAVRASGLPKAVHLSSAAADQAAGTGPTVGLYHQEARLNALPGLAVAHLRPAYFMENLLANIGLVQHLGITGSVLRADLALSMVATQDIAAKAAELLGGGNFEHHSLHYLLGPRAYSMPEATAAIAHAIGRPGLPYVHFSYEEGKKGMLQSGMSENMADLLLEMSRNMNEGTVMGREPRTVASTTPTTLEEFAQTVFAPAWRRTMATPTA